jgi:voltage-gated potassium channel
MRTDRRRPFADPSLVGPIRMPDVSATPLVALLRRLAIAIGALIAAALVVYLGRDGYIDNNGEPPISFNDAFYYATVSLSTTGYGDIVPVTAQARLLTTLVITPLRLLFSGGGQCQSGGQQGHVAPGDGDPALVYPGFHAGGDRP